ncbi:hemerythrin domain-containing protein [Pseudomarimonas salicorniae]|uniref:Hemerythrin domain-containing protein n=1 Tax=Pseudomarimonas salicorniae TaxID=2933270 RepID=A0ABT0GN84_9GAMM|nr:hemerythrin domain-containing protein [Lysobacter sp. CAU 1642]MCK7595455.1 hemerythrin domain-containing protein [Lysobacter sp. CAU 1642]
MSETIFEALREDHDRQRRLIEQLAQTEGDSEERRSLFDALKSELAHHAAAEERHFYVPLIDSDLTQEKARHSIAEHHEIDELVDELESMDMANGGWLKRARHLFERVEHHLEEEEHEVFQLAGKALTEAQKRRLATDYTAAMKDARADAAHD